MITANRTAMMETVFLFNGERDDSTKEIIEVTNRTKIVVNLYSADLAPHLGKTVSILPIG